MADHQLRPAFKFNLLVLVFIFSFFVENTYQDILGCGGFLKSQVPIDFSKVEIKLYTKQGTLKESSDCAPTNGYYFIPLYDKGEYLLKIEPPAGWYFEPKEVHLNFDGVNDPCSKSSDINFVFKGFAIHGKVVSAGSGEGPENVIVDLSSDTQNDFKLSTITGKNGYFQFTPIVPGKYTVMIKHNKLKFLKYTVKVTVKDENLEIPADALVVAGYNIIGQVLFNGEPTKGVTFVLLAASEKNQNVNPSDCSRAPLENFNHKDFICHVLSDEKGIFKFETVPPGAYKILPHYVKFDVKPEELNVVVRHSHVTLNDKFLVKGFSVSGRVLTSPGGSGISKALIHLNGQKVAMTDKDGRYILDSMEPGSYVLTVQSGDVRFDEVVVKVSPNTPEIENVYPSEFRVCGRVTPTSEDTPRSVEVHGEGKTSEATVESGEFCIFLKPGRYTLGMKMTESEKSTGMLYLPLTKEIHVTNGPINDIEFTQLRGNISGRIVKLPEAGKAHELSVKLKLKTALVALKILQGNELAYNFLQVMPGHYDVELENDRWCFQNQVHSISVTSSETKVPDFVQTGFKLRISSSHETSAVITDGDPEKGGFKQELVLRRGENVVCLPRSGSYRLQAVGCHGFEREFYLVDAKDGGSLRLNAVSHDVTGFVRSSSLENDLVVEVALPDGQTIKLGPLKGEKENGGYTYNFKYRTKENQHLKFAPKSSQLLFQPETFEFRTINECSKAAVRFVGEKGLIVEGRIHPPLGDVKITLKTTDINSSREDLAVMTKSDGKYKFGPLRPNWNFEITAEKDSYVFTGPDKDGVFKAHKLAEINVKVMDNSTKEPLQGVLLSLTGGEKYRKNSMTGEGGLLSFHSLSPGEYFLRPMMKEYKFEPSSQIIQIKEGVTESIELRGRRVSFSAYGVVKSLNGEPEPNVVIEAVGINTCSNLQEEASSEANGGFRIRGLLPQCEYMIRLKSGPDVNTHIHRLAPQDLVVRTNQGDVRNIELIAFQLIEQTDVSVHVESTVPEHLKTLRLKLCKDDAPDSPIHVVKLDTLAGGAKHWGTPATQERFLKAGLLVQMPFIPRDKTPYFIQLESTLNKHTYSYKEPVVHFIADKTYRNFKMTFEPVMKVLDHELTQSNYIIVPLLFFAGLLYSYFHRLVPAVQSLFESFNQNSFSFSSREERNFYSHSSMTDSVSIEPVGVTAAKRKTKPRKA